jgi:hypothetical protein
MELSSIKMINFSYRYLRSISVCFLIVCLVTSAKKNNARAINPKIASSNSNIEDSISGIKRSSLEIIVLSANRPNAIITRNICMDLVFLYATNDIPNKMAAKKPEPKSKNYAIFPFSRISVSSPKPCTNAAMVSTENSTIQITKNEVFFK